MTIRLLATALTATVLATGAASAAPKLAGTYTMTNTEICQAVGSGSVPSDRGRLSQGMGTVTIVGNRMDFVGHAQAGKLVIASNEKLTRTRFGETQTFAISGTGNPYVVKLTKPSGRSIQMMAHLDEIDARGVAGQMVLLGSFANGHPGTNCVTQTVFVSH